LQRLQRMTVNTLSHQFGTGYLDERKPMLCKKKR
jgi:hypothetical protein